MCISSICSVMLRRYCGLGFVRRYLLLIVAPSVLLSGFLLLFRTDKPASPASDQLADQVISRTFHLQVQVFRGLLPLTIKACSFGSYSDQPAAVSLFPSGSMPNCRLPTSIPPSRITLRCATVRTARVRPSSETGNMPVSAYRLCNSAYSAD